VVRTVRVRLELEDNTFKQSLRDDATAMRTFDGEVRTLGKDAERTGIELKQTATGAKQLGDDVKRSSREVDNLGTSVKRTGDESAKAKEKVTGLGTETGKTRVQMVNLTSEIDKTKAALKALGDEFGRGGEVDVNRIRSLSTELSRLQRARDQLNKRDVGSKGILGGLLGSTIKNSDIEAMVSKQGAEAGSVFGDGFLQGAGRVLVAGGPVLLPAIAGLVAFAGAAIGGAALGTVGLGAIAAGIAAQFNDPKVRGSVTDLGNYVLTQFRGLTTGFTDRFSSGIAALKREMAPLWSDLQAGFNSLQPYVANLLARLGEGLAKLGPGLGRALEAAGPVLGAISKNIPTLLNGINIFFDEISKGGKGAAEAIDAIMKTISAVIAGLGFMIRGLSNAFDAMAQAGDKVTGILAKIPGIGELWKPLHDYVHGVATSFDETKLAADGATGPLNNVRDSLTGIGLGSILAADDFSTLSSKISATAMTSDALAGAMVDKLLGSMMSIDQANLSVASSLTQVTEGVKTNGHELDIHTAKGQANTQAILGAVQANIGQYDALIRSGAGAEQAAAAYDANTGALEHQMHQAGFTQAQIDGLIGKYRGVPANVDTDIATYGLTEAINGLNDVIRLANHLDGRVSTVTIQEIHRTTYTSDTAPSGFFKGLAKGGVVSYAQGGVHDYKMSLSTDYTARSGLLKPSNPGTILAGEPSTGGEVFGPRLGVSHERGLQLAGVLAGWHGGMVVRPTATTGGGGTVSVELGGRVELTLDGRKVGELLINDADHGGTAVTTFIRRVANR
jgi:hypothetical protein